MKAAFIACEYNPFHNGHKLHLEETKKLDADACVCIMSGNFVQRGDIAVAEKHIRAKTAVINGADLVIELPLKYAVSTASLFAEGFIKTAKATGVDGIVSFGAKNSLVELQTAKDIIFSEDAEEFSKIKIREGISYPTSKNMFLEKKLPAGSINILDDANNVLALEYLHAIDMFFPECEAFALERKYAFHNSDAVKGDYASASLIRNMIYDGLTDISPLKSDYRCLIPENALNVLEEEFIRRKFPADIKKFDTAVMSRLSFLSKDNFAELNNVNEGLENRIFTCLRNSNMLSELLDNVKSKRFTYSRLRQIFVNAALGITKNDLDNGISYIRVLAFNERGREVLSEMKNTAKLPVVMNLSDIDNSDKNSVRDAELDYNAGKLFNLCLKSCYDGNSEYRFPPVIIK